MNWKVIPQITRSWQTQRTSAKLKEVEDDPTYSEAKMIKEVEVKEVKVEKEVEDDPTYSEALRKLYKNKLATSIVRPKVLSQKTVLSARFKDQKDHWQVTWWRYAFLWKQFLLYSMNSILQCIDIYCSFDDLAVVVAVISVP